jgi:hypothetical protein
VTPVAGDEVRPDAALGDDVPAALDSDAHAREQTRRPAGTRWLAGPADVRGRMDRRRDNIVAEIERNRRGEYRVPTWVLALVLLAMVAAVAAFAVLG